MAIYNLSGGGSAILEKKTVTPSTMQQTVTPSSSEYDGLSEVVVNATPLTTTTITPSTSMQTVSPPSPYIGYNKITVNKINLQSKTVTPSSLPYTSTPDATYKGLSSVTFNKDSRLLPENIKSGVTIYGVTGTLSGIGVGPDVDMVYLSSTNARIIFSNYNSAWFTNSQTRIMNYSPLGMGISSGAYRVFVDYMPGAHHLSSDDGTGAIGTILITVFSDTTSASTVYYLDRFTAGRGNDGTLSIIDIPIKSSTAVVTGTFVRSLNTINNTSTMVAY